MSKTVGVSRSTPIAAMARPTDPTVRAWTQADLPVASALLCDSMVAAPFLSWCKSSIVWCFSIMRPIAAGVNTKMREVAKSAVTAPGVGWSGAAWWYMASDDVQPAVTELLVQPESTGKGFLLTSAGRGRLNRRWLRLNDSIVTMHAKRHVTQQNKGLAALLYSGSQ